MSEQETQHILATLRTALMSCTQTGACHKALQASIEAVHSMNGTRVPMERLAHIRNAAHLLREASNSSCCSSLSSMEEARRAMTAMLFEETTPHR